MTGDNSAVRETLSWSVSPRKLENSKVSIVVAVAVLTGVVAYFLSHNVVLGILGIVAVLGSTAEFWVGSHFKLTKADISSRKGWNFQGMRWDEVRTVAIFNDSLKLSPFDKESRLESIRGITLTFPEELREQVIEYVNTNIGPNVRILEG